MAQFQIMPLKSRLPKKNISNKVEFGRTQATPPLTLPFFDDFSNQDSTNKRWILPTDVLFNNEFAVVSPTIGVATFDGLKANGKAYDTVSQFGSGQCDTLASNIIDLSSYTNSSNIYMSFFWQAGGLSEIPDSLDGDEIVLSFKSSNGNWIKVWNKFGDSLQDFKQVIINIKNINTIDSVFLHQNFQFKFESYGRRTGVYDVWNIDYIYINSNRNINDLYYSDRSFGRPITNFLKKYFHMPIKQYNANRVGETNLILKSSVNNLLNVPEVTPYDYEYMIKNMPNTIKKVFSLNFFTVNANQRDKELGATTDSVIIPLVDSAMTIVHKFSLRVDTNNIVPGINYKINNIITKETILDNFYAYDDGSAEYASGINQKFGRVAIKFRLNQPDTLYQIAYFFTQAGKVLSAQTVGLYVWKTLVKSPSQYLYAKEISFKPSGTYNVHILDQPLVLSDSFYIGYKQNTDDLITFGWDLNGNGNNQISFDAQGAWEPYQGKAGSLMMRPVFGQYKYVTSLPDQIAQADNQFKVYPNPIIGNKITVKTDKENVLEYFLYTISGQLIQHQLKNDFEQEFEIDIQPNMEKILILKLISKSNTKTIKLLNNQ